MHTRSTVKADATSHLRSRQQSACSVAQGIVQQGQQLWQRQHFFGVKGKQLFTRGMPNKLATMAWAAMQYAE